MEEEKEEEENIEFSYLGSTISPEDFHKPALKQLSSPDELDLLFMPTTARTFWVWITLIVMTLFALLWLFFGSIPISAQGMAIVVKDEDSQKHPLIYAFFPLAKGKEIQPGMNIYVELSNVQAAEYGALVGKVMEITPYPVSEEYLFSVLKNKGLVSYLTQDKEAIILVKILPDTDPDASTGVKWTAGKGPEISLETGTVGIAKGTVGHIQPIYYFFPLPWFYGWLHSPS